MPNLIGTDANQVPVNGMLGELAYMDKAETLDRKQDTLVSGTNIKTINGTSVLGSGGIEVQPTLVSGTNIKTINGTSLLGAGNFTIESVAVYEYADRALLRGLTPIDKQQAIVKSIGLFVFKVGATDLDDDEICFATANGRWLLETVHWDFVNAQLPDIPQVVTVKANNPILTVGTVASVTFDVPAPSCKMGDIVIASPPSQLPAHITYHAFVAETGLIRMVVSNPSAAASGTFPTGDWSFAIFEQF